MIHWYIHFPFFLLSFLFLTFQIFKEILTIFTFLKVYWSSKSFFILSLVIKYIYMQSIELFKNSRKFFPKSFNEIVLYLVLRLIHYSSQFHCLYFMTLWTFFRINRCVKAFCNSPIRYIQFFLQWKVHTSLVFPLIVIFK